MPTKRYAEGLDVESLSRYVAARIQEAIKDAGYSQKSFAEKFGKTEPWMSVKLRKGRNLTLEDVGFFANCLGVRASRFLPDEARVDIDQMSFAEVIRRICREVISQEEG